jgi:hypothetical protein
VLDDRISVEEDTNESADKVLLLSMPLDAEFEVVNNETGTEVLSMELDAELVADDQVNELVKSLNVGLITEEDDVTEADNVEAVTK